MKYAQNTIEAILSAGRLSSRLPPISPGRTNVRDSEIERREITLQLALHPVIEEARGRVRPIAELRDEGSGCRAVGLARATARA